MKDNIISKVKKFGLKAFGFRNNIFPMKKQIANISVSNFKDCFFAKGEYACLTIEKLYLFENVAFYNRRKDNVVSKGKMKLGIWKFAEIINYIVNPKKLNRWILFFTKTLKAVLYKK